MNSALRLALAPVILVLSALSFPVLEDYRRAHAYGWLSPAMKEHWTRLFNRQPGDSFDHAARNILAEWCRLDPQRAGKLFAFLLCVSVVLNVALLLK